MIDQTIYSLMAFFSILGLTVLYGHINMKYFRRLYKMTWQTSVTLSLIFLFASIFLQIGTIAFFVWSVLISVAKSIIPRSQKKVKEPLQYPENIVLRIMWHVIHDIGAFLMVHLVPGMIMLSFHHRT